MKRFLYDAEADASYAPLVVDLREIQRLLPRPTLPVRYP